MGAVQPPTPSQINVRRSVRVPRPEKFCVARRRTLRAQTFQDHAKLARVGMTQDPCEARVVVSEPLEPLPLDTQNPAVHERRACCGMILAAIVDQQRAGTGEAPDAGALPLVPLQRQAPRLHQEVVARRLSDAEQAITREETAANGNSRYEPPEPWAECGPRRPPRGNRRASPANFRPRVPFVRPTRPVLSECMTHGTLARHGPPRSATCFTGDRWRVALTNA